MKALFTIIFSIIFTTSFAALKEVEFNWNSPSIIWENQTGYLPCMEPFYIKVTNCPNGTTDVRIRLYESSGRLRSEIARAGLKAEYTAVSKSASEFSALISDRLTFKRFYYIEVVITTVSNNTVTSTIPPTTDTTVAVSHPNTSTTVTTTTVTVNPTPTSKNQPAARNVITIVKRESRETKTTAQPIYAIPLKSEISRLEFLGSIGACEFSQKDFKKFDHNIGFVTGLKIKFKPVSTNSTIGRFGLYPHKSRWAAIFGTVINDLNYKSTSIKAAIFGLKPVIGLDYEFGNGAVGMSGGAIIATQDTKSKLNSDPNIVSGFFIGLSFSADVFQNLKKNIPASQNFPSTQGQ